MALIEEAIRRKSGSGGFIKEEDGFRGYSFHLDSPDELEEIILTAVYKREWNHLRKEYDA
jgi:hypothetical protein